VLLAALGYFATMKIPVLRGRNFTPADDAKAPKVAIIDERLARQAFHGADPLGKRIDFGEPGKPDWHEIIGIVGNVENDPPPMPQRPMAYFPFAQEDIPFLGIVLRTDGDPATLAAVVRDVVTTIDRDQPVSYSMTMSQLVGDALAVEHTTMFILTFFAAVALILAAMGIYGVMAHSVLERRHEIGIRMALGAQRRHVLAAILRRLYLMTGAGLAIGVGGAWASARSSRASRRTIPSCSGSPSRCSPPSPCSPRGCRCAAPSAPTR